MSDSQLDNISAAPEIVLMVGMASNRCIGNDNKLLWHLPEDLKHFKRTTSNKPIIMGRKTYDSIGRPLPNRTNIVVTRNESWSAEGTVVASSLQQAFSVAKEAAVDLTASEIVVIGGAEIYAEALPYVTRMYLTQVDANIDGDAFFPEVDYTCWSCTSSEQFWADDSNPYNYRFETWVKK